MFATTNAICFCCRTAPQDRGQPVERTTLPGTLGPGRTPPLAQYYCAISIGSYSPAVCLNMGPEGYIHLLNKLELHGRTKAQVSSDVDQPGKTCNDYTDILYNETPTPAPFTVRPFRQFCRARSRRLQPVPDSRFSRRLCCIVHRVTLCCTAACVSLVLVECVWTLRGKLLNAQGTTDVTAKQHTNSVI